jgi:hypothetical protein
MRDTPADDLFQFGTVALGVNGAEPASIGAVTERQFPGAHVFTMHCNTGFSVHLMPSVGWRGSMQQCRWDRIRRSTGSR